MTDKPERRNGQDKPIEGLDRFLNDEIHRKPSKASEHPKEQEKEAQEKPDHRYLNGEVHRKLSEASRQGERIDQPFETTKRDGIDTKPEHPVERAEEGRLPDNPDVESCPQGEGTAQEWSIKMEQKQITQGARQKGAGEQTGSSEQPLKNNPILRESNSQSESANGKHEQSEQLAEAKRTTETDTKPERMGEKKVKSDSTEMVI